MAIYYSKKSTLAASTALYTDASLTTPAANGYYAENGISRYQDSGILQTQASCSPCINLPYTVLSLVKYSIWGSTSKFEFNLSNPLPFDIDVKNAGVNMYSTISNCNSSNTPDYQDTCTSHIILANSSGIQNENGSTPPLCSSVENYYYKMNSPINITVGVNTYNNLSNGYILTVNGYDIFIQLYPECYFLTTTCN